MKINENHYHQAHHHDHRNHHHYQVDPQMLMSKKSLCMNLGTRATCLCDFHVEFLDFHDFRDYLMKLFDFHDFHKSQVEIKKIMTFIIL